MIRDKEKMKIKQALFEEIKGQDVMERALAEAVEENLVTRSFVSERHRLRHCIVPYWKG